MINLITWITVVISIAGTFLIIRKQFVGFSLWCCSNVVWIAVDINAGLYAQAALFTVYLALSAYGIWEWKQEHKKIGGLHG